MRTIALLTLLMLAPCVLAQNPTSKPVYPLYAIASSPLEPSQEDLEVIARNFVLIQGNFTREQIDALHNINPKFKVLKYRNSTYTTEVQQVGFFEKNHRDAIAVHLAARLKEGIGKDATTFRLSPVNRQKNIGIKASTIPGAYSSADPKVPSTKHYVTWIRIDDEFMRVDAFDRESNRITVTRGLDDTSPASHRAEAPVLAPVYIGAKETSAYPDGTNSKLRYFLDPAHPACRPWLTQRVADAMNDGFDGLWLDILDPKFFNACDACGNPVEPWDVAKNQPYNRDEYGQYQQAKINFVQNAIKKQFNRWPVLVGNSMAPGVYEPGAGGAKLMLMPTNVKPRPIDGYCIENFAGSLIREPRGKEAGDDEEQSPRSWAAKVSMLMDASQNRLAAFPMLANAGHDSNKLENNDATRDRIEMAGYASFLLAVEPDTTIHFGIPAFYRDGKRRYARVHPRYYWPIGKPLESHSPEQLQRYRVKDNNLYLRRFENGIVLINPTDAASKPHKLDRPYIDPETGQRVDSLTLDPRSGKILMSKWSQ